MTDHFHRLGLPRRFVVDAGELERAYLARSRAVHPDYHLAGSAADLGASLELSAAVNEAYNTLRDPLARAEHLLALEGGPGASEQKQMPPEFLAEMLEAREEIEQARAGCPDDAAVLGASFEARFDAILTEAAGLFAKLERLPPDDPQRVNLRRQVRGLLNAARYVRGLIRDLRADQE
jgi:molecular chaperone HscB